MNRFPIGQRNHSEKTRLDFARNDHFAHPNQERYPGQMIYVVDIDNYLYLVPFVTEPDGTIFLKTIIPSRKAMSWHGRR